MRDDYYTNERDYRPDERAYEGTDFKYDQGMNRDHDRAPDVGSGYYPTKNYRADDFRPQDNYDEFHERRRGSSRAPQRREQSGRNEMNTRRSREDIPHDYEPHYRGAQFDRSHHRSTGDQSMRPSSYGADRGYDEQYFNSDDNLYASDSMPAHGYHGPRQDTNYGRQENINWGRSDGYHPGWLAQSQSPFGVGSQFGGAQTRGEQTFNTTADRMYDRQGEYEGLGPKNYKRSTEKIHEEICEALTWNRDIDASEIDIEVSDEGEVTMKGTAHNRHQKRLAEDLAEAVRGVTDVHNQIKVHKISSKSDEKKNDQTGKGKKVH